MAPIHVVFDLNGTLTDPSALGAPWQRPELGAGMLDTAVQAAMADALTGRHRPFSDHVAAAVEVAAYRHGLDPAGVPRAVEAARSLPAWPDARPALDRLRSAGLTLAVLTNSGAESGRETLRAAGLEDCFEEILGADGARTVKPDPRAYEHALAALGCEPPDALLVAAHGWDVTGAKRVGMRTCWISHTERKLIATAEMPDLRAAGLAEAAEAISGRA